MYQAHAQQLLNQKESDDSQGQDSTAQHPLFLATRRLVGALDRLEDNLNSMAVQQERDVQQERQLIAYERENNALKQETEQLGEALSQLQYQYNDLHKVASTMYGKLDDSIKRLTQIIDE